MSDLTVHLAPQAASDLNRNISLDILKIVMAYMVVGLHTDFLMDVSPVARCLTVNGLFRIAVPIFLMISGFFFYSTIQQQNTTHWFKRILLLYGFWMLFYSYFWFRPDEFTFLKAVKLTIPTLLLGYNHLWYLPAMIGGAALLYLVKNLSSRFLLVLSLILFFIGTSIQYIGNYHLVQNIAIDKLCNKLWAYRNFLFFAFPFFCIGYVCRRTGFYTKMPKIILILLTLGGLALLLVESYLNFAAQSVRFDILAALIIVCPLIFLFALSTNVHGKSKSIALYATAIYFIHPLFISIFKSFALSPTILAIAVAIVSTFAASVIIKANSRVPIML